MQSVRASLSSLSKYTEILVAFAVVGIIAIIILPMPAFLLDLLLTVNLTISIMILVLTLFTKTVLEFSIFPSMLLVMTMFRLGLNISSTRLILSEGKAGEVINAFATFVTGNNYVVGAVIFIIITIVQMVVVTNGAGRVSEVGARFTLDAMPGKQMAIDADLNSGLINEETAKKRRQDLQREADFYGSMDGASKFVKGDAIAGIIITIINLLGGIIIFSLQGGMTIMESIGHFGRLTIGDGLVSQIPSLLISVASGMIVTRSGNDKSFGSTFRDELFSGWKVMGIGAVVILAIGLVPAFPTMPFAGMAALLGVSAYLIYENDKDEAKRKVKMEEKKKASSFKETEESVTSYQVEPISLEIGYGLIPLVDEGSDTNLVEHITSIRKQCAREMGILISPIRIRDNLQLDPHEYVIKIKGNQIAKGEIYVNKYLVIDPGTQDFDLTGIETVEPAFGLAALWIDEKDKERADLSGYTIVEPATVLVTHLKELVRKHSYELLGRQETKLLVDEIREKYGVIVEELIPGILSLGEVQKVLQNLLRENVPIIDLVTILETLADHGVSIKDTEILTEHVRHALQRTIVKDHLDQEGELKVVTIDPQLEDLIGSNIHKSMNGSIPVLEPEMITRIFGSIRSTYDEAMMKGYQTVILASPKIRTALKNLIAMTFPDFTVLSLNEVPNDIPIEVVGMVEFR
ncbi:flagellar biosynthesis protein FlhA [Proteiniclasticum sp. SCR006]|uniref:Flagellar biosynthesis protein FlhA n=1 Tax=Proteiniclasticum aestuarii TaxID=2817862 RepID=A0A939KHE0_9CLOT|nr:flagellar biosynthesis protein FlhA [Proteiniclasticum aestuarii]MBO1265379.1 flagellar biosynthesis protein FlhA [Proteiniclasticum aestuarii]